MFKYKAKVMTKKPTIELLFLSQHKVCHYGMKDALKLAECLLESLKEICIQRKGQRLL